MVRAPVDDLKEQIRQRQVVVIVGAGISLQSTRNNPHASWRGLLHHAVDHCATFAQPLPQDWATRLHQEVDSTDIDDLLGAAEKITSKLGGTSGGEFRRWLRDTIGPLRAEQPEVIKALQDLDVILATTNYDSLIEQVTNLPPVVWLDGAKVERLLRGDERGVLHLHGHWDRPESVILGIRSYEKTLGDEHAQTVLRALQMMRTLVFVGFGDGLDDPNFRALLTWTSRVLAGSEYRRFRLCRESEAARLETLHPDGQRFSIVSFGQQHNDLAPFLQSLLPTPDVRLSVRPISSPVAEPAMRLSVQSGIALLPWPHDDLRLKAYCEGVSKAHSHIRFVEIPFMKDMSDIDIDRLYVEPRFSAEEIHADTPPHMWQRTTPALDALREHNHLVLLGDPGSGKSTFVSWLVWQLCRPKPRQGNPWTNALGGLVPLPIVLRELRLTTDLSWEGLVDAFLQHRFGQYLQSRAVVTQLLHSGRALVLLDGLDEIGNLAIRRKLRDAVHSGIATYPDARWVLTSRIVGYDHVPFHLKVETLNERSAAGEPIETGRRAKRIQTQLAHVAYLAPLTDAQISQFSIKWYTEHEKERALVEQRAGDFVQAIRENEGTQRLARIPYLLTLMALIHHKNARLPYGRTELYARIAAAYLESIDLRRQLDQLPYSLAQKKRWLADIAYRMQLRRNQTRGHQQGEAILASKADVAKWLRQALADAGAENPRAEAETLLDYFAERSGLLLPRAEGKFAFMHLSLQEYFAACFLEPCLTASRFVSKSQKLGGPSPKQLRLWVNDMTWSEALVLLFELLAERGSTDSEALLTFLFAKPLNNDAGAGLLSEIATDPFVSLTAETRRAVRRRCWKWAFQSTTGDRGPFRRTGDRVIRNLLREQNGDFLKAWAAGGITKAERRSVQQLDLSGCASLRDLGPLSELIGLGFLNLSGCRGIGGLTPLSQLKKLKTLVLESLATMPDLTPIATLPHLTTLYLGGEVDLRPLSASTTLAELHLHYRPADSLDLTPLAGMRQLRRLCKIQTGPVKVSEALIADPDAILSVGVKRALAQGVGPVPRRPPRSAKSKF